MCFIFSAAMVYGPALLAGRVVVFSCSGFTVYDPSGNLIFRVDKYCSHPKDEVLLMDAAGTALLTMRRKRLSLHNEWQGFLGEFQDAQKPLFVVKRAPSLLIPTNKLAEVYVDVSTKNKRKPHSDYYIEGCYAKRYFTILNSSGNLVAEVKSAEIKQSGSVAWLRPSLYYGVDYHFRSDDAV